MRTRPLAPRVARAAFLGLGACAAPAGSPVPEDNPRALAGAPARPAADPEPVSPDISPASPVPKDASEAPPLYPDRGLELRFEAAEHRGPYHLAAVRAGSPCTFRTARGIGLGDPLAAVERAYLADRAPGGDDHTFIVGAADRGIRFTLTPETRTVAEIFLGPPSE